MTNGMPNHTPGPWGVSAIDETLIVNIENYPVATTFQGEGDYASEHDRRYADACIIAASHDLLSVVRNFLAFVSEPDPDSNSPREKGLANTFSKARDAIAKAEGKAGA